MEAYIAQGHVGLVWTILDSMDIHRTTYSNILLQLQQLQKYLAPKAHAKLSLGPFFQFFIVLTNGNLLTPNSV